MGIRSVVAKVGRSTPGVRLRQRLFRGSASYWEQRYAKGGTSGAGSYGRSAEWKATAVNAWVAELDARSAGWVQRHRPEWVLDRHLDPPADIDLMSSLFLYTRAR